ncbi:hypothetical protein [Streptomyces shenzhenensis]|uniref:hypothetical protein n=1 Tax=Streptomyces shenzhenensis TaxID=943815 RepID=UPI001F329195|nr:hypothetical protein [Streptomyces shenzhenensis]
MTTPSGLRLLPWAGPGGKPCYLNTDDPEGFMSRLADHIESIQLGMASQLLEQAAPALDDETANGEQLRLLAAQLVGALRDVLRVATSRGRCHGASLDADEDSDL